MMGVAWGSTFEGGHDEAREPGSRPGWSTRLYHLPGRRCGRGGVQAHTSAGLAGASGQHSGRQPAHAGEDRPRQAVLLGQALVEEWHRGLYLLSPSRSCVVGSAPVLDPVRWWSDAASLPDGDQSTVQLGPDVLR